MAINSDADRRRDASPAPTSRRSPRATSTRWRRCWEPGSPDVIHGVVELRVPDDLRSWFGDLFAAFPDFIFEVLDVSRQR